MGALPAAGTPPTARELEILDRLTYPGATRRSVADELGVSVRTVDGHLAALYRRLRVNTAAQAWRAARGRPRR